MGLLKRLIAEEAFEGSVVDVHGLHVLLHVAARAECAAAVRAHEVLLFEVNKLHVSPQRSRAAQLLSAGGTFSKGSGTGTAASTGIGPGRGGVFRRA